MIDEPKIVQSEPQQMAFIHVVTPREHIQDVMGPGYMEVMDALRAQGIQPSGPWFTHHLKLDPKVFDFEICVPVNTPVKAQGRVQAASWPARRVARTIYRGSYEGLSDGWGEFEAWLRKNGHKPAPDLWEIYTVGPESGPDSSKWQTELNRPIAG